MGKILRTCSKTLKYRSYESIFSKSNAFEICGNSCKNFYNKKILKL
ncbi:hypothetical protein LEP1GSC186_4482 [Leptospira noguchii serovar Autumnalis str. ZUN142]|uniref:Uncharacterized protein n=1 Tax=Leptospira noguchii serovar Autumnalis str. ZUN142 TaxID=1085540 RepID=M6UHT3_9LEPT|nr:hypothetical protein LEP1GSC186_4482 [Leptospira noguchii serovar Autumnalis str. ZUN142]